MEGGDDMVIVSLVVGIIIGVIITSMTSRKEPIGTLRVDYSDPDSGPYLFLEIPQKNTHLIEKRKMVSFKVNLTQK